MKWLWILSIAGLTGIVGAAELPVCDTVTTLSAAKIPSATTTDEAKIIDGITRIIQMYIDGNASKAETAATVLVQHISGQDMFEKGARKIVDYLSGKPVSDEVLFLVTEKDSRLCALAFLSMFVRKVSLSKTSDKAVLTLHLDNYVKNAKIEKNTSVSKWIARTGIWKDWIRTDYARKPGLEKLLVMSSGFEQIADVPKADFIAHHIQLQKLRPKVNGIIFDKTEVIKYLESIQDINVKRAENRRYAQVQQVREYITSLLARNAYSGKILLKNQPPFTGTIVRANENQVVVQKGSSSRAKSVSYNWDDFKIEQFAEVIMDFGLRRVNASTREGEGKQRLDAGEDLMRASILFLFADMPDRAYDAATAAEKMSPAILKQIKKVYCDSLPSEEDATQK